MRLPLSDRSALIFDLDGTLADSMPVWKNLSANWLHGLGIQPEPNLEIILAPLTFTEAANYCIDRYQLKLSAEATVRSWQENVIERYRSEVKLKPGVRAFLETCRQAEIPLSIATACLPEACEALLQAENLTGFFQGVLYSDSIGRNKTHPDIFLACAKLMQASPADCIVFEDSVFAAQGVRSAGMKLVAVHDISNPNWTKLRQSADLAIMDFTELLS